MTVIGIRKTSFKGDSGDTISGINVYVSVPIPSDKGSGDSCDRLFFTVDKLLEGGYNPAVGDEVQVEYNKYGKPSRIRPADED